MPSLKEEFETVDLPTFKRIAGDAEAFRSLQELEKWASEARRKVAQHISENREKWLNDAREKVALKRQNQAQDFSPPHMSRPTIEQEAQRLVAHRAEGLMAEVGSRRQARLDQITNTPGYDAKREAPSPAVKREAAHPLKKETHAMIDRAARTRDKVERHFHKMKSAWIDQARERGAVDPVGEVYANYRNRKESVRQATHRLTDRSFKSHGIDRASPESSGRSGPNLSG
ncbi:MAG TPA: hypothetical protein EYG02_06210 [Henriciella marina]|uniref:hypothetical protein n=1 Tax=Henriciella sp. TaxID=1968823 RepID=UPI0017F09DA5|nr:hypothetical protein [Henriciella sp.]HIG21773.1 hypothetical protein [Henriciella sp.]HIK64607.1 hypothetical protein [Henriciella marina]